MNTAAPRPGDTVVALATLSTTAATPRGALDAGPVLRVLESAWWEIVLAVVIGGTIGRVIGTAVARGFYSGPGDRVRIVRAGVAAAPKTLPASSLGALAATIPPGPGTAGPRGGPAPVEAVAHLQAASAILVAFPWGALSTLPWPRRPGLLAAKCKTGPHSRVAPAIPPPAAVEPMGSTVAGGEGDQSQEGTSARQRSLLVKPLTIEL